MIDAPSGLLGVVAGALLLLAFLGLAVLGIAVQAGITARRSRHIRPRES